MERCDWTVSLFLALKSARKGGLGWIGIQFHIAVNRYCYVCMLLLAYYCVKHFSLLLVSK